MHGAGRSSPCPSIATEFTSAAMHDKRLPRNEDRTLICLLLVGDADVTPTVIAGWTDEQCEQAEKWAMAIHLAASDNDAFVQPAPECVKQLYNLCVN